MFRNKSLIYTFLFQLQSEKTDYNSLHSNGSLPNGSATHLPTPLPSIHPLIAVFAAILASTVCVALAVGPTLILPELLDDVDINRIPIVTSQRVMGMVCNHFSNVLSHVFILHHEIFI